MVFFVLFVFFFICYIFLLFKSLSCFLLHSFPWGDAAGVSDRCGRTGRWVGLGCMMRNSQRINSKYHGFKKRSSSFIHYKWPFRFQIRRKKFLELTAFDVSYSSIQKFQVSNWHQRHASATFCDVHSLNMFVINLKVKFNVGNTIILV